MLLWRISNHASIDGHGGLVASARWHTRGRPIIYFAATPAGALVEVLVNLELDFSHLPQSYKLLKASLPDNVSPLRIEPESLPPDWREDTLASRSIGDDWLEAQSSALLMVPSAILPETYNLLLNPNHADAHEIQVLWHRNYPYDQRLFKKR